jgi:hypothetical protein
MNLYIRLKNGQPFEHPIFESNFRQAFPDVDLNNLPEWVAKFVRVEQPSVRVYEVYEGVSYQWVDGVVTDVHAVRQMTNDEKLAKQNEVKANWTVFPNWASWTFNEDLCRYEPPIPRPNDGKAYRWDEPTVAWVEIVE